MNVVLLSSSESDICPVFLASHRAELDRVGVKVPAVVLDENQSKESRPFRHLVEVATRQSRVSKCSIFSAAARLLCYKVMMTSPLGRASRDLSQDLPYATDVIRVGTLNSSVAVEAVASYSPDLVCLMGTRILTKETIDRISVPIINIHSSDPRLVRGGPVVVWDILGGRDEIALTVHEVVPKVDCGSILAQLSQEIVFVGGLGPTTRATMALARTKVADLFFAVILKYKSGNVDKVAYEPGPLRVVPSIQQLLRADMICRGKTITASRRSFR